MLPVLMYNNMEGCSNNVNEHNTNYGQIYDENVILNSVRSRKKVSELPNCPVCSCTVRQGELEHHLDLELARLNKLTGSASKRKLSVNSVSNNVNAAVPGSSTNVELDEGIDVTGCPGSDVYQRVHANRLRRLRARRRSTPPPQNGECPVCNTTLPTSKLQRHALRCLKRTGAEMDEDIPDTSSEEGSIDVENDEPSASGFGAEYQWCGEWRVRATALQDADSRAATCVRRASNDQALVVDGDEDTELYGPPQYSPSRIAPDDEHQTNEDQTDMQTTNETETEDRIEEPTPKCNGLVEASAETRIQALKAKIKDMEKKQNGAAESKCLICLGSYVSPAVSIQCWHVYCEVCWLESLKAKKICPQCNAITTAQHLRRIYM
ncbi:E3 ubiquitin-protein ligase Rnf220 isoform X2 [Bombyx mori]|uniref:RING-type domain-containing protein n=1 Tax=Bombyx mori TaxID=7091 RepID=A0A8R2AJC8_BOMMO|nr:E3 ubiquitin-protein ligase Rnf220 isoform X2 [Bombyx mori]